MPLEVTPIPFADQQLPYTPKFIKQEMESIIGGSNNGGGSVLSGPARVQANAIIPPAPGGIAGPHHAIAALPEAGYTAPSVRPINIPIPRGHPGPPPSLSAGMMGTSPVDLQSVYAGGSMYQGHSPALSVRAAPIYSDGWASSSLPEPKRAPLSPQSDVFRYDQYQHPHHQHRHEDESRYHEQEHHRHHHHHHHHHQPSEHGQGQIREYEIPDQEVRHHRHRSNDMDDAASNDGSYYARPRLSRCRTDSIGSAGGREAEHEAMSHPHRSTSIRSASKAQHQNHGGGSNTRSVPVAMQHSLNQRDIRPLTTTGPPLGRSPSKGHAVEESSPLVHTPSMLPIKANALSPGPDLGDSRVPPPIERQGSPALDNLRDQEDRRFKHHRHRSTSHAHREPSPGPFQQQGGGGKHLAVETPGRRRALSMHELEQPLDEIFHQRRRSQGFAPRSEYYPQQPMLGFDDGASVAGSALTFMDGSIGGRVSQYGLPKYQYRPKPDYRRFCVQRGNADVYLD